MSTREAHAAMNPEGTSCLPVTLDHRALLVVKSF
jgi:hypothetical protein